MRKANVADANDTVAETRTKCMNITMILIEKLNEMANQETIMEVARV